MSTWVWVAISGVELLAIVALSYALVRYVKRLFQYDDLYQFLFDDVETNLRQFERIRKSFLLQDDDEVRAAHKNMITMAMRLDEFANRMEETTGKKMRKVTASMTPVDIQAEVDEIAKNTNG